MVSAVLTQGLRDWQRLYDYPIQPQLDSWKTWLETVEKARKYDEMTKQPNCEDPAKEHILADVLKRVEELEKHLAVK